MEIGAANRPDRLIQPKRLSSVSQASSVRSTSLSPDDGYDYNDAGPPPEGSATKENENSPPRSVDLSSATHSGEPVRNSEATTPNLFWRPGGGRRAQKPDEDILTDELVVRVSDYPKVSDAVRPNVRKNRWHRPKRAGPIDVKEIADKTKLRFVRLHWEKEEANGEKKIVLDALVPGKDAKFELPNHVIWQ